jgi:ceramide glucosyltransferase
VFSSHLAITVTTLSFLLYAAMMGLFARAMLAALAVRAGRREADLGGEREPAPKVSIFKPMAGVDDDLEQNLESFARIDYPSFEILFGVADRADPAYAAARAFALRHPGLDVKVVVTRPGQVRNPKVSQLIDLEPLATGDIFLLSDSNVRVAPDHLRSVVRGFADARVGMVMTAFVGTGEKTLGAALENLQICASTLPGLVAVNCWSPRPLAVGKAMGIRREDLAALGGFASVGDVLAEDHVLARRFLDAGRRIATSLDAVENRNTSCSLARTIERHTRWAKLRRSLLPSGFALEPIMTPVVVANAALLLSPSKTTAAALAAACALQTAGAMLAVRIARGRGLPWWFAPLEVVRSYVIFGCWLSACVSRRIAWRGHPFILLPGSVIVPLPSGPGGARGRSTGRTQQAA